MAADCGAALPGSGMAADCGAALPGSGMAAGCGAAGDAAASGASLPAPSALMGNVVWHRAHFSLAPPGGIRLSSML
ncbi:hypothetical protein D7X96_36165 [Corallococcus interemptor]|uniref:Uncharacterized protein n=1 Tax=Corallococcus interemptor TaxID=2316720 RepID=A0A3A8PSE9_9BACT|nr:hypothetical protein D7X96_36165 [Corallococcus interemptor]